MDKKKILVGTKEKQLELPLRTPPQVYHSYIVGKTMSGKSTLAKNMSREFLAKKESHQKLIVLDCTQSGGWGEDKSDNVVLYGSVDQFLQNLQHFEDALVIIDDAKILYDADASIANQLLYAGRHRSLQVILISQRFKMIPPNSRSQITKLYAFTQSKEESDEILKQFDKIPESLTKLKPFEFYFAMPYLAEKHKLVKKNNSFIIT